MSDRTREKPLIVWIATKDGADTVYRECPNAFLRASYDNVMPFIEKTAFNLLKAELKAARAECERLRARNDDLAAMALTHATRANDNLREANELRALLKEAEGALRDADYVLAGSIAIEGQSDAELEAREKALIRFLEMLAKLRGTK